RPIRLDRRDRRALIVSDEREVLGRPAGTLAKPAAELRVHAALEIALIDPPGRAALHHRERDVAAVVHIEGAGAGRIARQRAGDVGLSALDDGFDAGAGGVVEM